MSTLPGRRLILAVVFGLAILTIPSAAVFAGEFENLVRARWRGAWVVIDTESYSDCGAAYTTNKVSGRLVSGSGRYRFEEGELAKVDRVQVKGKRVELHTSLDVELLAPYDDGPFTLYDVRSCRLNVRLSVPREVTRAKDVDAIDGMLAGVVERHASREEAYASDLWNGRELESFPDDYEITLARHAAWNAEQLNISIDARLDASLDKASALAAGVDDDPEYLSGFATGTRAMRAWTERDCGVLVGRNFARVRRPVSKEQQAESDDWKRGYADGQQLVYSLALLERLDRCYVEVPRVPETIKTTTASRVRVREAAR